MEKGFRQTDLFAGPGRGDIEPDVDVPVEKKKRHPRRETTLKRKKYDDGLDARCGTCQDIGVCNQCERGKQEGLRRKGI